MSLTRTRHIVSPDLSTFRFDCRGLGESEGATSFTPHYLNLADLESAIEYLENERKMKVCCIFGYSAGGNVAIMYVAKHPHKIPFVTVHSGRFAMSGIRDTLSESEAAALRDDGFFNFRFTRRGKEQLLRVDDATVEQFANIDMEASCREVPASTHVLCTHGIADDRVPPADSAGYVSNLANVTQHLLLSAGHDYKEGGVLEELYVVFREWLLRGAMDAQERRRRAFARL